jgi:hypothetical protein
MVFCAAVAHRTLTNSKENCQSDRPNKRKYNRVIAASECVPEQIIYSGAPTWFRDESLILGPVTYSGTSYQFRDKVNSGMRDFFRNSRDCSPSHQYQGQQTRDRFSPTRIRINMSRPICSESTPENAADHVQY